MMDWIPVSKPPDCKPYDLLLLAMRPGASGRPGKRADDFLEPVPFRRWTSPPILQNLIFGTHRGNETWKLAE